MEDYIIANNQEEAELIIAYFKKQGAMGPNGHIYSPSYSCYCVDDCNMICTAPKRPGAYASFKDFLEGNRPATIETFHFGQANFKKGVVSFESYRLKLGLKDITKIRDILMEYEKIG